MESCRRWLVCASMSEEHVSSSGCAAFSSLLVALVGSRSSRFLSAARSHSCLQSELHNAGRVCAGSKGSAAALTPSEQPQQREGAAGQTRVRRGDDSAREERGRYEEEREDEHACEALLLV